MTSRPRERRRGNTRTPGILRGPVAAPDAQERPPVQHGAKRWGFSGLRAVSAMISLLLVVVLAVFFATPIFYIHSISIAGLKYMTKEEIFALTDVADLHIFWVVPAEVRRNILRSPTVADAQVTTGWPPNMVQVVVQEREPALVWQQSGVNTWVDVQGRVMNQREDRPDLLRIESDVNDGPLAPNVLVDLDVVTGALQLKAIAPSLTTLRYDPIKGLGYQDQRGWQTWFGTGTNMPERIRIYNAIVNNLISRGIQPSEINAMNPDAPFYAALRR